MSRHSEAVYLHHMLDYARAAVDMAAGKERSSLDSEPMLRYALLHLVSILGEAANRVSVENRSKYGQIAWRDMVSMRNMLIHGYDIVDMDILWKTIEEDIPPLIGVLQAILAEEGNP